MIASFITFLRPREVDQALEHLIRLVRMTPTLSESPTAESVASWMLAEWFGHSEIPEPLPLSMPSSQELIATLRASSAVGAHWQRGWVARKRRPGGICLAERADQRRRLYPGEYINLSRPGVEVAAGDHIAVSKFTNWVDTTKGLWRTLSLFGEPKQPKITLTISTHAHQIGVVVMAVHAALAALKLRYMLSCPNDPFAYMQPGALAITLEASAWPLVEPTFSRLGEKLYRHICNGTPPLTRKIARGIAFAEEPCTTETFGESRCRALAPGVLALLKSPALSLEDGRELLSAALLRQGINPRHPWICRTPDSRHKLYGD